MSRGGWQCGVCNGPIEGPASQVFDQYFHNECFRCSSCQTNLLGAKCVNNNGQLLCIPCASPACARCGKPVSSGGLRACNQIWHQNCFTCSQCGSTFDKDQGKFMDIQGQPYCVSCSGKRQKMPTPTARGTTESGTKMCSHCSYPLLSNQMVYFAMNKGYHDKCFLCKFCGKILPEGRYVEMEGAPSCNDCATRKLSKICTVCNEPIIGKMVTVLDKEWHPHCLTCSECNTVLRNYQKIYKKENRPVCPACVESVFNLVKPDPRPPRPESNKFAPRRGSVNGRSRGSINLRGSRGGAPGGPGVGGSPVNGRQSVRGSPGPRARGSISRGGGRGAPLRGGPPPVHAPPGPTRCRASTKADTRSTRMSICLAKAPERNSSPVDLAKRKTELPVRTTQSVQQLMNSFTNLLTDDRSVNALLNFMTRDYSVENLLFYLDAVQFREMELNDHDLRIYSKRIWQKYFCKDGGLQINVEQSFYNKVYSRLGTPASNMFDETVTEVVDMMNLCTYQRFKNSPEAEELIATFESGE